MARTALVLSAGGMFGAYQAGVWKALADHFKPDLIVGASIGALNGWAIAGECDPDELIGRWRNLNFRFRYREKLIREIYASYRPQIDFGLVITETFRLRPRVVRDVTWQHLAASAAIPGLFRQPRIEARYYCDGGLLCALPLWAAAEMGADKIIAINALPVMPSTIIRAAAGAIRHVARFRSFVPESIKVIQIAPSAPLGAAKDALCWNAENTGRWIKQGMAQALPALRQFETLNAR